MVGNADIGVLVTEGLAFSGKGKYSLSSFSAVGFEGTAFFEQPETKIIFTSIRKKIRLEIIITFVFFKLYSMKSI